MVTDAEAKAYISRILLSKIQGAAATATRRLVDPTWTSIKKQLVQSFGVPEEYLQLKEKADNIQSRNVSSLYNHLSAILDKLNLKYSLDCEKPSDFKPNCNEKSILEKFLNKIDRVDAMFIRTKGIETLEEAYQALLKTGINNRNPRSDNSHNNNNQQRNNLGNLKNFRYRNGFNPNSHNRNYQRNSVQYRRNHSQSDQYVNRNFNQRNFNEPIYRNPNRHPPPSEPMDVDHNVVTSENFHSVPPIRHYR